MGLRKGKRKALHITGEIVSVEDEGPYTVKINKLYKNSFLAVIKTTKKLIFGQVWITLAPLTDSKDGHDLVLKDLRELNGKDIEADFESSSGSIRSLRIVLDDRGRAKNLRSGKKYRCDLLTSSEFFKAYEMKSIPVSGQGRSEPQNIGNQRIRLFNDLIKADSKSLVLDCATGMKLYLKSISNKNSRLVCANYSLPILMRTRNWLNYDRAIFVQYDASSGFPFKEGIFDTLIFDALLEYLDHPCLVIKKSSVHLKQGGMILILEPITSDEVVDFYPQDLWELAIYRPMNDQSFKREILEDVIIKEGFELASRSNMKFSYNLFSETNFSQSVSAFKKFFIL